jgi:hypothetical protein
MFDLTNMIMRSRKRMRVRIINNSKTIKNSIMIIKMTTMDSKKETKAMKMMSLILVEQRWTSSRRGLEKS